MKCLNRARKSKRKPHSECESRLGNWARREAIWIAHKINRQSAVGGLGGFRYWWWMVWCDARRADATLQSPRSTLAAGQARAHAFIRFAECARIWLFVSTRCRVVHADDARADREFPFPHQWAVGTHDVMAHTRYYYSTWDVVCVFVWVVYSVWSRICE